MVPPGTSRELFGTMLVLCAGISIFWAPYIAAEQQASLSANSKLFNIWIETRTPTYLEVFFFNITNVDDILAKKDVVKIQVKEIGPYVFRETSKKTNLTWNTNSTLTFYNQRWWRFVPEKSVGLLSDKILNVNPILAALAYKKRHSSFFLQMAINQVIAVLNKDIFLKANVSSLLFDGISDPIQEITKPFFHEPKKFAWFYNRNGSVEYDGSLTINTGATDLSQLGNVEAWRFSNRTAFRDECGEVKGSTGELWAPEYGQEEMSVFSPNLCSYLTLNKDRDVNIHGVDGVEYSANDVTFDNGHKNSHKACFCEEEDTSKCPVSGALNATNCRYPGPLFVSLPHFLHADPYYPSKIEGLNATEDMNYKVVVDKKSGLPLSIRAQLQYNLLIRHVKDVPSTLDNTLPDADTLVPMFWFRETMETTPEYARLLQTVMDSHVVLNNKMV